MRSTKYDKKGSAVEDLVKRLEVEIYSVITTQGNFYREYYQPGEDTISLLESLDCLRKATSDIAERTIQQMMKYDLSLACEAGHPPVVPVHQNDRYFEPMGIDIRFSCGRGLGFQVSNAGEIAMTKWVPL